MVRLIICHVWVEHSEFGLVVALYEMVFNLVLNGLVSRDTHPNTHTTIHNITC